MKKQTRTQAAVFCALAVASAACTRMEWKAEHFTKLSGPELDLGSMPPLVRGGTPRTVRFEVRTAEALRVETLTVHFSEDGGKNWAEVRKLEPAARSFEWSVPSVDRSAAQLKIKVLDNRGNDDELISNIFRIRSSSPLLTLDSPQAPVKNSERELIFEGKCETGLPIQIDVDGAASGTSSCAEGKWSHAARAARDSRATYRFRQDAGDGLITTVGQSWLSDANAPKVDSISVRWEVGAHRQFFTAAIDLDATDSFSGVTHYCVHQITPVAGEAPEKPGAYDRCFRPVQKSGERGGSVRNHVVEIPYEDRDKPIYVWVKDEVHNVSQAATPGANGCVAWQGDLSVVGPAIAGSTYQWVVTNREDYGKVTFQFGTDVIKDVPGDGIVLKNLPDSYHANLVIKALDSCERPRTKSFRIDREQISKPTPPPTAAPCPTPPPTPAPPAPMNVTLPAPQAPNACAPECPAAVALRGDCNGNGVIDNETLDEVGMLNDPNAGSATKCAPGLVARQYDVFSPGRNAWQSSNCQPGYKCLALECIPTGAFTRDRTGAECCSKIVSQVGQCIE